MLWVDFNCLKTNTHLHQPSRSSTTIPVPLGQSMCPLYFSSIPNVFRYMEIVSWHLLNLEEKLTSVISYVELFPNIIAIILYFLEFETLLFGILLQILGEVPCILDYSESASKIVSCHFC